MTFGASSVQYLHSMPPLAQSIENNKISHHSYSNDTQIYISLCDYSPIKALSKCIVHNSAKICLQLDKEKTEMIVFGPKKE